MLLNWTYSPAVATYFAMGGSPDTDGVVWAVDYETAHERLPDHFQAFLEELGTSMFNAAMLYDLMTLVLERTGKDDSQLADRHTLPMLDVRDVLKEFSEQRGEDYIVFFQLPSIDQRIVS